MSYKNIYSIKKEKFDFLLILFSAMLCVPFSVFSGFTDIYFTLSFLMMSSIYLISNSNLNKKSIKVLTVSFSIMILFSLIYIGFDLGYVHSLIIQLVYLTLMIAIYLYFTSATRLESAKPIFMKIIIFVSVVTIMAFLGATFKIIPFPMRTIGGYDIGYNFLFGGVSMKGFYRPQWYFSEPSYLGFFLGFAFLFLKKQYWIKYRIVKLALVFIAGVLVFSMTFYFSMIIGLISELIIIRITRFMNPMNLSKVYLVSFVIISAIYITQLNKVGKVFFSDYSTSFINRKNRIDLSLATLKKMNFWELSVGKGTGFISIDKTRKMAESDSYIRTLIENGAIVLIIYLFIIYYFLRNNPSLLLYTLVALSSVVVLETPFFMLIILLAGESGKKIPHKIQLVT